MEFIDAKIWISKNASLCRVFTNWVTYVQCTVCIAQELDLTNMMNGQPFVSFPYQSFFTYYCYQLYMQILPNHQIFARQTF